MPGQEHLLRGGAVGDPDEVDLRVLQRRQDVVDVVGEHRGGVVAQVDLEAGHARLDGRPQRRLVGQLIREGRARHVRGPRTALFDEDEVAARVGGQ